MAPPKSKSSEVLYVRIDPELKQKFQNFVSIEEEAESERRVVEQILRNFLQLPDRDRKSILRGGRSPIASTGRAVELLAWGDHAFNMHLWEWGIKIYTRLDEESPDAQAFQRIARYKLGLCWLEIAIGLRKEAESGEYKAILNRPTPDEYYQAADESLMSSVRQNERFLEIGKHPVVRYNLACCCSLRAQYAIERALWTALDLTNREEKTEEHHRHWAIERGGIGQRKIGSRPTWENMWASWRSYISDPAMLEELNKSVAAYADRAMEELDRMVGESAESHMGEDDPIAPSDQGSLIRLCAIDPNFAFLRINLSTKDAFEDWVYGHIYQDTLYASFVRLNGKPPGIA